MLYLENWIVYVEYLHDDSRYIDQKIITGCGMRALGALNSWWVTMTVILLEFEISNSKLAKII